MFLLKFPPIFKNYMSVQKSEQKKCQRPTSFSIGNSTKKCYFSVQVQYISIHVYIMETLQFCSHNPLSLLS